MYTLTIVIVKILKAIVKIKYHHWTKTSVVIMADKVQQWIPKSMYKRLRRKIAEYLYGLKVSTPIRCLSVIKRGVRVLQERNLSNSYQSQYHQQWNILISYTPGIWQHWEDSNIFSIVFSCPNCIISIQLRETKI
jgi:hypothetical protein